MKTIYFSIMLTLVTMFNSLTSAAQESQTGADVFPLHFFDGRSELHTNAVYDQILWRNLANKDLVAKDGNYLAQDKDELQTYYDLKMDYEYIESDLIRKQLRLNSGEGILVQTCDDTGQGYAAGFREGDLVLTVGDQPVDTQYDFVIAVTKLRGEHGAKAAVRRDGKKVEFDFYIEPVKQEASYRWIIGVMVESTSELLESHLGIQGAVVTGVTAGGPAEKMSIRPNDIVLRIDNYDIHNLGDLGKAVQASKGKMIKIELLRAGNKMSLELKPKKLESKNTPPVGFDRIVKDSIRWRYVPQAQKTFFIPETNVAGRYQNTLQLMESLGKQIKRLQEQIESLKNKEMKN